MYGILLAFYVILVIFLSIIVLVQEPKEGGLSGVFGGGGGMENILGAKGAPSFFAKVTAVLGTLFILLSLGLSYMNSPVKASKSAYIKELNKAMHQQRQTQPAPVKPAENSPQLPQEQNKLPQGGK